MVVGGGCKVIIVKPNQVKVRFWLGWGFDTMGSSKGHFKKKMSLKTVGIFTCTSPPI